MPTAISTNMVSQSMLFDVIYCLLCHIIDQISTNGLVFLQLHFYFCCCVILFGVFCLKYPLLNLWTNYCFMRSQLNMVVNVNKVESSSTQVCLNRAS